MQENGKYQIIEKYRKKTRMARSVWWDKEVNSERGTLHLKKLFENKVFDNPKPEETLNRVIEMATKKGDIVLDYHLGSGTTCAVAHKMGRQYIGIEQMDYDGVQFVNVFLVVFIQFKINKFASSLPLHAFARQYRQY
jgi:adenine-specific DNA-methyltransferase